MGVKYTATFQDFPRGNLPYKAKQLYQKWFFMKTNGLVSASIIQLFIFWPDFIN